MNKGFMFGFVFGLLIPSVACAAEQFRIVPDCGDGPCTINHLFVLGKNILDFSLKYIMVPLATISIAIAGFKLIGTTTGYTKMEDAKKILQNVLIGIVLAFGAWIIVNTIVSNLLRPELIPLK